MSKHWEPCPRCGSKKVDTWGKSVWFFLPFASGGCLVWVGIIFWPIWIAAAAFILISPFGLLMPKMNHCRDCRHWWDVKKKKSKDDNVITETKIRDEDEPIVKTEPKPKRNDRITFRVAGITKTNDKGEDIQSLLKEIVEDYRREGYLERYSGYTKREMIEDYMDMTEYEGQIIDNIIRLEPEPDNEYDKNAIKVFIKDSDNEEYHIGYVKRKDNKQLKHELENNTIKRIETEFIGGEIRRVEYDDFKDKEYIETDELTRGIEVTVWFENEIQS